jgi:ABC-2 type transport system ATP-binding protein
MIAGSTDDVRRRAREHHRLRIHVIEGAERAERFLLTQPLVQEVAVIDATTIEVDYLGDEPAMASLLQACVREGLPIYSFAPEEADLEEIFLRTTKGRLQ